MKMKTIITLIALSIPSIATDDATDLDLRDAKHYHKEIILRNPYTGGGLFFQVEDEPFSLKKVVRIDFAPKLKVRKLLDKTQNLIEKAPTVFSFLQESNLRNVKA